MCTFILLLTRHVQNRVFRFRLVFTTSLRVCFVSVSPFWVYPPDVCLKQTHKQTKAQRSRRFYCLCKFYTLFETSLCWCWLVILLLYSYRHSTHTYIQTRDTHTTLFYTPKKNKQYFNPQSSLAAIFNVFSSTVFLLVYLVIGVTLFSKLSVFTKFFPTLSRQTKQKQISRYKRQKFIHINIFFPLFI